MSKTIVLPPQAPRYRSILRLQRFMKDPIPFMNDNLARYGDTYSFSLRYNKVNILTVDPDLIQHILRKNVDNYEKPDGSTSALAQFLGKGLLVATGAEHARQRKTIAPVFRPRALSNLTELMSAELDRYFGEVDGRLEGSPVVTIDDEMRRLTFRVMCKAIYGDDMDAARMERFSGRFQTLQAFLTKVVRVPSLMRWYDVNGKARHYRAIARDNADDLLEIIAARRSRAPQDDLLGLLAESRYEDTELGMTDRQLLEETLILFVAGHETAANILSWIFYLLARHPEAVERIRAEERAVLGGRRPEFSDLMKMEYLTQVIDECLRLYPPSWITDRVAKRDDRYGGFDIPAGARVIPFIYGLHHSPKLWTDPEAFDPGRFTKENRKARHNFAHMPFGAGPRMCIGRHFATMEMKMVVLAMIGRYRFRLVPGQKIAILPAVTLKPRYGIKLELS